MDFTCAETQIGDGNPLDCEIVKTDGKEKKYAVKVPA